MGEVAGRRVGHGQLDRDVGAPQVAEVVADVEATDEFHVRGRLDRLRGLAAHAPTGADHCNLDRLAHGPSLATQVLDPLDDPHGEWLPRVQAPAIALALDVVAIAVGVEADVGDDA